MPGGISLLHNSAHEPQSVGRSVKNFAGQTMELEEVNSSLVENKLVADVVDEQVSVCLTVLYRQLDS